MSATILPPPVVSKGLRLWVWHPDPRVPPKLVRVLRVLKGKGTAIIANDHFEPDPKFKEFGIPVAWFNVPENAESVDA